MREENIQPSLLRKIDFSFTTEQIDLRALAVLFYNFLRKIQVLKKKLNARIVCLI